MFLVSLAIVWLGVGARARMNFARDVVEAAEPRRLALIERARDGARREWSFGEVAARGAARSPRSWTPTASGAATW